MKNGKLKKEEKEEETLEGYLAADSTRDYGQNVHFEENSKESHALHDS